MTSRIIYKSAAVSAIALAMVLVGCDSSSVSQLQVNEGDVVTTYQVAGMT